MSRASTSEIKLHRRPSDDVSLSLPKDVLASLERIAKLRDMSLDALLRFYIGQGLREELARLDSQRVLETTAEVLARHIPDDEAAAILREIQQGTTILPV